MKAATQTLLLFLIVTLIAGCNTCNPHTCRKDWYGVDLENGENTPNNYFGRTWVVTGSCRSNNNTCATTDSDDEPAKTAVAIGDYFDLDITESVDKSHIKVNYYDNSENCSIYLDAASARYRNIKFSVGSVFELTVPSLVVAFKDKKASGNDVCMLEKLDLNKHLQIIPIKGYTGSEDLCDKLTDTSVFSTPGTNQNAFRLTPRKREAACKYDKAIIWRIISDTKQGELAVSEFNVSSTTEDENPPENPGVAPEPPDDGMGTAGGNT